MDVRRKTFVAEATARLEFLLREHGFVRPQVTQDGEFPLMLSVRYHRSDLDVDVSLVLSYMGEEYVTASTVDADAGSTCVNRTEVGLQTAHTGFQMRRALDHHAEALRQIVPQRKPGGGSQEA